MNSQFRHIASQTPALRPCRQKPARVIKLDAMTKQLEISFDNTISAYQVRRNLLRLRGVHNCTVTGPQTVTVAYDESRIAAKLIAKAAGRLPDMPKRSNITSIRELTPSI